MTKISAFMAAEYPTPGYRRAGRRWPAASSDARECLRMTRPELRHLNWPDRLSGWTLPPPSARVVGEREPVRVFESADAAMAFLALARRGAIS